MRRPSGPLLQGPWNVCQHMPDEHYQEENREHWCLHRQHRHLDAAQFAASEKRRVDRPTREDSIMKENRGFKLVYVPLQSKTSPSWTGAEQSLTLWTKQSKRKSSISTTHQQGEKSHKIDQRCGLLGQVRIKQMLPICHCLQKDMAILAAQLYRGTGNAADAAARGRRVKQTAGSCEVWNVRAASVAKN